MTRRSSYRFGALALAAATVVGCLSLLLTPAAAVRAASAPALRATHKIAERPPQAVAYARPAVVRVLVRYYGTTSGGTPVPVPVFCVGTGALVGTTGANSFNYVLTASSLVNPNTPCEGARAAFQQINGPAQAWGVDHIEIWLGAAYTGAQPGQLGTIKYRIEAAQIVTLGGPYAPKLVALSLSSLAGAPKHDLPVLQPPQPSDPPAGSSESAMDLGDASLQPLGNDSVVDSQVIGSLYPVEMDAGQLGQEVVATPTRAPSSTPQPTSTTTPTAIPATPAQQLSLGTPVVNDEGRLTGMVIADATGARVIAPLSQVVGAIGAVSGKAGPLMSQWTKGLAAFYSTPPDFASAATAFNALRETDPDFGEVAAFLSAAKGKTTAVAPLGNPATPTPTPSPVSPGAISGISLPLLLGALGLVLFAVLLVVALLIHRMFEGRRAIPLPRPAWRSGPAREPVRMPTARVGTQTGFRSPVDVRSPASASSPVGFEELTTQPHQAVPSAGPASFAPPTMPPSFMPDAPPTFLADAPPAFLADAPASTPTGGDAHGTATNAEELPTWVMAAAQAVPLGRGVNLVPQAAGVTDPGQRRASDPNQDNVLALVGASVVNGRPQAYGLFVIADGMGGHTNGQEASRHTIEVLAGYVIPALTSGQPLDAAMLPEMLRQGAMRANAELREQNLVRNADMGTTMTAALVLGEVAYVANIGDSRTYVFSPDYGLRQITTDHSVVASLVTAGVIRPEDIYTHPRRNQIYRSLGGQHDDAEVDTFQVALQAGDKLLLCSDGLWEMVRDPQIEAILRTTADPHEAANLLVREANNNGGEDNISVIVVRMLDEQAPQQFASGMQVIAAPEGARLPMLGQGQ
jgi:serine/threonine protein phosphatase PrpC